MDMEVDIEMDKFLLKVYYTNLNPTHTPVPYVPMDFIPEPDQYIVAHKRAGDVHGKGYGDDLKAKYGTEGNLEAMQWSRDGHGGIVGCGYGDGSGDGSGYRTGLGHGAGSGDGFGYEEGNGSNLTGNAV